MRIPELVKEYCRYYRILRNYRVRKPIEYLRLLSPNSTIRVLDLLPFRPKIIFDVGAYRGAWTRAYYRILGGEAEFHLFEPGPNVSQELKQSFQRCVNVHIHELALSSEGGQRDFHIAEEANLSSFETGRLLEAEPQSSWRKIRYEKTIQVKTDTLDHFYKERMGNGTIDLLKLDVQGHELAVLEGTGETLKKVRGILIEWNIIPLYQSDADFIHVHQWLTHHGFALAFIPFQYREHERLMYADALYLAQGPGGVPHERPHHYETAP